MTETEKIIRLLERSAQAAPSEEEMLARVVTDWLSSPVRAEMLTGARYYQNRNDILSRKRLAVGEHGRLTEDPVLPNRRISHGFVRKLVDQKSQYLFGRSFTVSTDNEDFARLLEEFFDRQMRDRMKNLCKEAVNKGIAWLQLWPEGGRVLCKKLPSEEVIPIWADREHTELESLLRVYAVECHEGKNERIAVRVEHWDKECVRYFELENGKLIPDVFCPEKPHLTVNGERKALPVLPFVPFKYNEEELPLIRFIKDLVDDYDLLKSEDASNLSDTSGAIMVLKDYDGTDLGEFRRELGRYRAVKVSDAGGLEIREMPVHTDEVLRHLSQDRKDIYEIGRGVDTQSEKLGQASGVAMKFLYADLDLDCSGIESQFLAGLERLIRLAAELWKLMGCGNFTAEKADIIINRDMIISESDAIADCVRSGGILSRRTVLENHPWVTDAAREMERLGAEEGEG